MAGIISDNRLYFSRADHQLKTFPNASNTVDHTLNLCIILRLVALSRVRNLRRRNIFLVFTLLAFLDFFVPFYLLGNIPSFLASYAFWSILTLTVIIVGAFYINRTWGG